MTNPKPDTSTEAVQEALYLLESQSKSRKQLANLIISQATERAGLQAAVDDLTKNNHWKADAIAGLTNTSAAQDQEIFELQATVKEMREALEDVVLEIDYMAEPWPYTRDKPIFKRAKEVLSKHKEQDNG